MSEIERVVALVTDIRDRQPKIAYNAREAGAQLGVSDWLVRRLVAEGVIRKVPHMGSRVLIPHRELERLTEIARAS